MMSGLRQIKVRSRGSPAALAVLTGLIVALGTPAPGAAQTAEDTASASANPLVATSIEALQQSRDRPIFLQLRRPSDPSAPTYAQMPPAIAASPAVNEAQPFTLLGTITGASRQVAVLQHETTHDVMTVEVGDSCDGWRVHRIEGKRVTLQKGSRLDDLVMGRIDQQLATAIVEPVQTFSVATAEPTEPPGLPQRIFVATPDLPSDGSGSVN